jgi:hypothetical protein
MIEVIESKGRCENCGRQTLLGNGLCQYCWDNPGKERKLVVIPKKSNGKRKFTIRIPRYTVKRQNRCKTGEYRKCIVCGSCFYLTLSRATSTVNHYLLCRKCNRLLPIPPRATWINGKKYGRYDKCPICGKLLVFHLINRNYPCKVLK